MVSLPQPYRLNSVRLKLIKTLTGPYARLLRRPWPEVAALGNGETVVIIRGTRIMQPVPLWSSEQACYYAPGVKGGWDAKDFKGDQFTQPYMIGDADSVDLLAVPVAHMRLDNDERVKGIVEELSPWRAEPVERWRREIRGAIWLSLIRVYSFERVAITLQDTNRLHAKVRPFRAKDLRAVIEESDWLSRVEEVKSQISALGTKEYAAPKSNKESEPQYDLDQMVADTGFERREIEYFKRLLDRKKQLVIYGPPGTGKSYIGEKLAKLKAGEGNGFWKTIQFHPSYSYEDFVQGLRPVTHGDQVVYELVEGAFLRFCQRAEDLKPSSCVLVIDELNRAPLAHVLGELIYLLEYRERAIALSGGGAAFSIPDNVFIVATMNAADRSIALIDQAIIRRFAFVRLLPKYKILDNYLKSHGVNSGQLIGLLQEINALIENEDMYVGISFFMCDGADLPSQIGDIWRGEIEPYLKEAMFDRPSELEKYRWEEAVKNRLGQWDI